MRKSFLWGILSVAIAAILICFTAKPSLAHWADLAVADVTFDRSTAQITLTIPTGLVAAADTDKNGRLSPTEIQQNQAVLQKQLSEKIQIRSSDNQLGKLVVSPMTAPSGLSSSASSHSTLRLDYSWARGAIAGMKMHYGLFEPGVATARCLTTITSKLPDVKAGTSSVKNVIFSPENQEAVLFGNSAVDWSKGFWVTLIGAFIWGAAHATSPGHGKTLVGTYLIGERATAQHALFLGLTTTVTHTLGVFTLGGFMLLASQTVVPEQILPWLSLLSGLLVVLIGGNLFRDRLRQTLKKPEAHHHHHDHNHHDHDHHNHSHDHHNHDHHSHEHHSHEHPHEHSHGGHSHSHLPPEGPVSWRSLFALGVSGGLIPCPSALVLLLSSIAVGQVAYGMLLVLSFSLGLAIVLTGLGLILIYSKHLFIKLPLQKWGRVKLVAKVLPACTALAITLIGVGISLQALGQLKWIPL